MLYYVGTAAPVEYGASVRTWSIIDPYSLCVPMYRLHAHFGRGLCLFYDAQTRVN